MKMNKFIFRKKLLMITIVCLLTVPFLSSKTTVSAVSDTSNSKIVSLTALTPSGPIEILNDTAFDLYGLPGNGSTTDPYRIENLNITTSNTWGIFTATDALAYFSNKAN